MINQGIREISQRRKLVFTWYGLNLLFALVIVAPIALAMAGMLGDSLETKRLFDNFDISWITEFGYSAHWNQLVMWLPMVALLGGAFVLLTTWLSGGLLAVLHDPRESFTAGCGRWLPPFVRLLLLASLLYGVAFAIRAGFASLLRKLGEDSMSGQPAAYGAMATFVITFAACSFVTMLVDYAKIHMVTHGERKARRGLAQGIRFVFGNLKRCLGIYLGLTVYLLLMLAVYHMCSEVIGQASIGAVLLLFVVRQIYMLGRTWLRMVFLASEHAYFASRIPKPASKPEPLLEESLEFNESY